MKINPFFMKKILTIIVLSILSILFKLYAQSEIQYVFYYEDEPYSVDSELFYYTTSVHGDKKVLLDSLGNFQSTTLKLWAKTESNPLLLAQFDLPKYLKANNYTSLFLEVLSINDSTYAVKLSGIRPLVGAKILFENTSTFKSKLRQDDFDSNPYFDSYSNRFQNSNNNTDFYTLPDCVFKTEQTTFKNVLKIENYDQYLIESEINNLNFQNSFSESQFYNYFLSNTLISNERIVANLIERPLDSSRYLLNISCSLPKPKVSKLQKRNLVFLIKVRSNTKNSTEQFHDFKNYLRFILPKLHPDSRIGIIYYHNLNGKLIDFVSVKEQSEIILKLSNYSNLVAGIGGENLQLAKTMFSQNPFNDFQNDLYILTDSLISIPEKKISRIFGKKERSYSASVLYSSIPSFPVKYPANLNIEQDYYLSNHSYFDFLVNFTGFESFTQYELPVFELSSGYFDFVNIIGKDVTEFPKFGYPQFSDLNVIIELSTTLETNLMNLKRSFCVIENLNTGKKIEVSAKNFNSASNTDLVDLLYEIAFYFKNGNLIKEEKRAELLSKIKNFIVLSPKKKQNLKKIVNLLE